MADRYTGLDVAITFDSGTGHFQSIEIEVEVSKFEAPSSDSPVMQRGDGMMDAKITLKGWETDASGGLSFADVAGMVLSREAPSALSWTDTAGTPATRLPAGFFTSFPLSGWRVDKVTGGSAGAEDPSEWTAELSPNNFARS